MIFLLSCDALLFLVVAADYLLDYFYNLWALIVQFHKLFPKYIIDII